MPMSSFNLHSSGMSDGEHGPKLGDRDPIVDFARGAYNWQVSIIHIDTGVGASFPAFITDYSETFNSDWNEENYFGRNDKIGRFAGTSRTINLGLDLPSFSMEEARLNMHQVEHLIATMYPTYEKVGEKKDSPMVMKSYPLVRVKFANLIKKGSVANGPKPPETGLAGWIPSLSINPDLEAGFHSRSPLDADYANVGKGASKEENASGGLLYPKTWKMTFTLRVVHEHKLGWNSKRKWIGKRRRFPWGAYAGFTEKSTDFGTAVVTSEHAEEVADEALQDIFAPPEGFDEV